MHAGFPRSRFHLSLLAAILALLAAGAVRLPPGAALAAACLPQGAATCEHTGSAQPDARVAGNPNLVITSPTPGSTLTNLSVTHIIVPFTWNSVSGASAYALYVGTDLGGRELGSYFPGTSTSTTVTVLPAQAGSVSVRLWADVSGTWEENDFFYTTQNSLAVTSPTPGSAFGSSSVSFSWDSVTGATNYVLYVGTSVDTLNLNSAFTTAATTAATLTVLAPAAGTVYVRLWVELTGSVWLSNDFLYTTTQVLAPSSPTPGSALSSTLVPFSWNSVSGSTNYSLYVGTSLGGSDLYEGFTTGTSLTATVLPPRTGLVYVRLWADVSSTWISTDFTYTTTYSLALSSPAPGSTLSSSSPTFSWNSVSGTTEYVLWVGSAPNQYDLFWGTNGTTTSEATSGLPTNGSTLFVEVWAEISSTWEGTQFTYTASGSGASGLATLSSPTPGSTLSSLSAVTFSWTAGTSVTAYALSAGSAVGRQDYYQSGSLTTTSVSVTGLPNDASTVSVELASKISGVWYTNSYTFTASGAPTGIATLTSPTPGSTLTSTSLSFSWTAGTGVTAYQLIAGAVTGECDYECSGSTTATSVSVTDLPSDGSTVYVSLLSEVGGVWYTNLYEYTSLNTGPSGPAPASVTLVSPTNGATSTGTTPTLSWNAPTGSTPGMTTYTVAVWNPYAGTGGTQLADISAGTSLSVAVPSGEGLAAASDYEWNVSACNGDACSAYGSWWLFTTSSNSGSTGIVTQSSPSNGATLTSAQGLTPTLSWGSVSGATSYIVSVWDPYRVPDGHLMADIAATGTSVAVPAAEGLFYSQQYYWNVRSCASGTCSAYNSTWFSFTTAAMTAPAPGGVTATPILNVSFANSSGPSTPLGWTQSGSGTVSSGPETSTYTTSSTVGLGYSDGGVHTFLLSYALTDPYYGYYGNSSIQVEVYSPVYAAWEQVYCDATTTSDPYSWTLCVPATAGVTGPVQKAFTVPSSLGSPVSMRIEVEVDEDSYSSYALPSLYSLQDMDGSGVQHGPRLGVSASDRFPKAVSASAGGVDVISGAFRLTQPALSLGGAWPLGFTLGYDSESTPDFLSGTNGPFGPGWADNWSAGILLWGTSNANAAVQTPAGSFAFTSTDGGYSFTPQTGVSATLTYAGSSEYVLTTAEQMQYTIENNLLVSVKDRFGNTTTLTWGGTGGTQLLSITQLDGHWIEPTYSGTQITKLTDNTGRSVSFSYNGSGQLATLTDVDGNVWSYTYDSYDRLTQVQDPTSATSTYPHGNLPVRLTYDSVGRVATFEDGADATMSYAYGSPLAGATTVTDQLGTGHTWQFDYASTLVLIGVQDPYSKVVAQAYDADDNVTLITDPDGQSTSGAYDSSSTGCPGSVGTGMGGNVCSVVDALGYEITNTYDSKNDVLTVTDQDGHTTTNTYNSAGGLTRVTDALANHVDYSLASTGLVSTASDANSHTTTYGYDSFGDRTSVEDPAGNTSTAAYDSVGRQVTATDPLGNAARKTYDAAGNVLTATMPSAGGAGAETITTYDAYGRALSVTDPKGKITTSAYDPRGLLLSVVDPLNGSSYPTSYTYDAAGNRLTVTDASNSGSWSYTYDMDGRPLTVTDPNGGTAKVTNTYDAAGRLATSTDGKGQVTTFSYDQRGTLTKTTYAGSTGSVTYTFDGAGNRLSLADSTGVTTYSYDADNHLTGVTYPGGRTVSYAYDAAGNRTSLTYPGGSHTATYGYDLDERLTSVTDWSSHTTDYSYDADSRLASVTLPAASGVNNVTGSYNYFASSALASINWTLGGITLASAAYTLDLNGNRTSRTTTFSSGGSAQTEGYCYDALNRLTAVYNTAACGTSATPYTVTVSESGCGATDPGGTVTYYAGDSVSVSAAACDGAHKFSGWTISGASCSGGTGASTCTFTMPAGNVTLAASFAVDACVPVGTQNTGIAQITGCSVSGSTLSLSWSSGGSGTYHVWLGTMQGSYNIVDRTETGTSDTFTGLSSYIGSTIYVRLLSTVGITYPYNDYAETPLSGTTYSLTTGVSGCGSVSPAGSIAHAAGDPVSVTALPCDSGHSFSGWTASGASCSPGSGITPCTFGMPAGAVTLTATFGTASGGSGSATATYTYDRAGNRTALTTSAGTTTYSYDSHDLNMSSVTPPSPASAISYSYDGNGSVIGRGSDSFSWDAANRLMAASVAGGDAQSMTYNGDGLRQSRTDSTTGVTTNFVWDVEPMYTAWLAKKPSQRPPSPFPLNTADPVAVPVVLDDGSQYVYGASGLVEQVQSGMPYYFLQDGLGSTMAVVDGTGTTQQTESYDVYGKAAAGASSHPTEYQFAGQQTDATGLQYLRARYYDMGTGRFLSRDPWSEALADPAAYHPYAFASGNPATVRDPSGKECSDSDTSFDPNGGTAPTIDCTSYGNLPWPGWNGTVYCNGPCVIQLNDNDYELCTSSCAFLTGSPPQDLFTGRYQGVASYCPNYSCSSYSVSSPLTVAQAACLATYVSFFYDFVGALVTIFGAPDGTGLVFSLPDDLATVYDFQGAWACLHS